MSGDQLNLDAIEERAKAWGYPAEFDVPALVAEVRRLREEADERTQRFARAWLAVAHEQEFAIDGTNWVRADKIRAALGGSSRDPA